MSTRSYNSIANRMTASVLIFSLMLTLVSFAGLYVINYHEAMDRVEMDLRQLAKANLPGIKASLWVMDMQQLQVQLDSLLNIPNLCEAKIVSNGRTLASAGTARPDRTTQRVFPLNYTFDGRTMQLGTLQVQVCYTDIYQKLLEGTYVRLLFQAAQIALVAFFMLYIFRCIVSSRLSVIKNHMSGIDTSRLDAPLELPKHWLFRGDDELDMLVESFNIMLARIEEGVCQRKQIEVQVLSSLREKEVLLKEIHHRVKNNMQVIYSLLNLQAKQIDDSQVRSIFEENRDRINSMALIHENLYQSADLARIDFKKYLETLVQGIAGTYCRNEVNIYVEMEPIALDVNIGIPCGLIVNELVSNSLKYAFPEGQQGTIRVGINRNTERENYLLTVEDNGIGFPKDLDFRRTKTLGMQLVTILSGQINGKIELATTIGTNFSITFPVRMETNA